MSPRFDTPAYVALLASVMQVVASVGRLKNANRYQMQVFEMLSPLVQGVEEESVKELFHPEEIHGCRGLYLEVIQRAASDWVIYRNSSRLKEKRLAEASYVWLFEEKPGHPDYEMRKGISKLMSFLSICSLLDLEPEEVRNRIRELTPKDIKASGRPREYRRSVTKPKRYKDDLPFTVNDVLEAVEDLKQF